MAEQTADAQLRDIAVRAREAVNADRCTIYELNRDEGMVYARVGLGLEEGQQIRLPVTRGVIGFVVRTGRSLRLRDVYNDPRFDPSVDQRTGYRTRSMICVPIFDPNGMVLGAIQAINKLSGSFTEADEATLRSFCPEAATVLSSVVAGER